MMEPKIRLKGFSGEWKDKTIDEIFLLRNGYTPSKAVDAFWTNGTIPWFRMEDIRDKGGLLKDAYQNITAEAVKGGGLFEANSIILSTTATIGVHAMLIADSLANQQFTNLSIRKSLADKYLPMFVYYSFFKIDDWCLKNTNSGGLLSVDIRELCKHGFPAPSLPEQRALATFFTSLDNQISAAEKRLASLKQVKAASLQAMFPQEGETTPKLRFKGCEGEWKKVKLGEVFELRNGYTPSKAVDAFWTNGTIPWFRMEDIRDKGGLLKDAYQKITPEAVKGDGLFEANSILLATTATIGVHAMLIADSLANQRFTNLSIRKSLADKYLPMFVYYAFFGIDEWCLKNTNTGGLLSVDINELCKLPFLTPSLTEQRQIASYFTSLDRQISAQSSKISKLKQIKSACLDQMFV